MENMRKVVVGVTAGTGMNNWEFYLVDPKVPQAELEAFAEDAAIEWAESFGIENPGNCPDPLDYDSEDAYDDAVDEWEAQDHDWNQVEGWVEEYNPEKHDGYSMTGIPDFREMYV